jgi:aldehyde:ferredoxin oxidoreductase
MSEHESSLKKSYTGRILHINLTTQTSSVEEIPDSVYQLLIGGKGLGIYLLLQTPPKIEALSEENTLIFITGPLTGTSAPSSNKFGVVTKSPATNGFLDAYSSGKFGSQIKHAGFDAIILHGKMESLAVLVINDEQVQFKSAQKLGVDGLSPLETEFGLQKQFGEKFAVASIGLAGEKLVSIAGIFFEQRCAGRGGAGAVMGSKNIKAIMINGTHPISVANPDEFKKAAWIARRYIRSGEITVRAMPQQGTANIIDIVNERHGFPTRNFQSGQFEGTEQINGDSFQKNYWGIRGKGRKRVGSIACYACPISCSKIAYAGQEPANFNFEIPELIAELDNQIVIDGPEYETIALLGPNIGNKDPDTIILANYLCDYYGIDTISTGNILGFVMECIQKEIISPKDLDQINPIWGEQEPIIALIRKIGKSEGCGAVLGKGVKFLSTQWANSDNFAMHVKGLELPGYDPRTARGMALGYAICDRGACHLHAFTASLELMGNYGGADGFDLGPNKLEIVLNSQSESNFVDCAVLCYFTLNGMQIKEGLAMLRHATGNKTVSELNFAYTLANRVLALTRMYNYREGITQADDNLPKRLTLEGHPNGPAKGKPIPEWDNVLQSYYEAMGWNSLGYPTEKTIKKYQIDSIIQNGNLKI